MRHAPISGSLLHAAQEAVRIFDENPSPETDLRHLEAIEGLRKALNATPPLVIERRVYPIEEAPFVLDRPGKMSFEVRRMSSGDFVSATIFVDGVRSDFVTIYFRETPKYEGGAMVLDDHGDPVLDRGFEINWSAIGSQPPERARYHAAVIAYAAQIIESGELKKEAS